MWKTLILCIQPSFLSSQIYILNIYYEKLFSMDISIFTLILIVSKKIGSHFAKFPALIETTTILIFIPPSSPPPPSTPQFQGHCKKLKVILSSNSSYIWQSHILISVQGRLSNLTKMEELQKPEVTVCWKDTIEQCNLEMLAYPMWV